MIRIPRATWYRLGILVLILLGVLTLTYLIPAWRSVNLYKKTGYYFMAGITAWLGWLMWVVWLRGRWRELSAVARRHPWGLLLVAVGTLVIHTREPHEFKIINDEPLICAVSLQMHETREVAVARGALPFFDPTSVFVADVDKRSALMPFLISIVHDLTGYRRDNVFLVNFLLTPVLLLASYALGVMFGGRWVGALAVILWLTVAQLYTSATSGGLELLFVTAILLWFHATHAALRDPSPRTMSLMAMMAVALSFCRYEGVVFVPITAAVCGWIWVRAKEVWLPGTLVLTPLLLMPYLLQFRINELGGDKWQKDDLPGRAFVFSADYVLENVGRSLLYFLSPHPIYANSILLAVVGLALLPFALVRATRVLRGGGLSREDALLPLLVGLVTLMGVYMFFNFGRFDMLIMQRLSLPFHLAFITATVSILAIMGPRATKALVYASLLFGIAVTLPKTSLQTARWSYGHNALSRIIHDMAPRMRKNKAVVITDAAATWRSEDVGFCSRQVFRILIAKWDFWLRTFPQYPLVVEMPQYHILLTDHGFSPADDLPEGIELELEEIDKFAVGPWSTVAYKRIVSIKLPEEQRIPLTPPEGVTPLEWLARNTPLVARGAWDGPQIWQPGAERQVRRILGMPEEGEATGTPAAGDAAVSVPPAEVPEPEPGAPASPDVP